jgi:MFS family permease
MQRPTHARHVVLYLTVAAYMITYMDRGVIATTTPLIRKEFAVTLTQFSVVLTAFKLSYALFQVPGGWLGDRIGPRRALSLIVSFWSAFTALTAAAWSISSMAAIRFIFGVGEAGAFPIATRSLSRWMRPSERGYAQGVTHAGSRLGAALAPSIVAPLMVIYGWRMPFVTFGVLGLIWAAVWFVYYRDSPAEHRGVNDAERELIEAGSGPRKPVGHAIPWRAILASGTLWQLCLMYFCYQVGLSVYTDWFPTYLHEARGMTLTKMGFYSSLPLLAGVAGDLAGGWFSDALLRRTGNVKFSRRVVGVTGFLIAAAGIVPATLSANPQACVAFTCLAFGGLELTVSVSWAIPLDIAADFAGSAAAVMNMCGNFAGVITPLIVASLATKYGWNSPWLVTAAVCIVGALLYMKIDASRRMALEAA